MGELKPPMPGRFHELGADKKGWLSVDLDGPYRLIYEPLDTPPPTNDDGQLLWEEITTVRILGVLNDHEPKNRKPV